MQVRNKSSKLQTSISPQRKMIETWFKNWWAQIIMRNLNFKSLNNFVSTRGAYYGGYGMSYLSTYGMILYITILPPTPCFFPWWKTRSAFLAEICYLWHQFILHTYQSPYKIFVIFNVGQYKEYLSRCHSKLLELMFITESVNHMSCKRLLRISCWKYKESID